MKRLDLRRDDGVAMTEFALVVPVLLLLVAGMLGFGRALFYWIEANHLANETARWAVVDRASRPHQDAAAVRARQRRDGRVHQREGLHHLLRHGLGLRSASPSR